MKIGSLYCLLLGGAMVLSVRGVEPPLPGEDGPRPDKQAFQPLLEPGDVLPLDSQAPVLPEGPAVMPPELFPEGSPLYVPADGEKAPPVPFLPGATPPEQAPPGLPDANEPSFLPPPSSVPTIPGMELAARAYWHRSPREAREVAKRERKPLLMFFYTRWKSAPVGAYGSGAIGDLNIAINDDLLATPEFNEWASPHVVLTRLFYPINPGRDFPEEKKVALQQFKDFFKVKGFPYIILLDENGRELERVKGYRRVSSGRGEDLSSAMPIMERLKAAVARREAVIAADDEKLARLLEQNFREWTSLAGSKLMAKMVSAAEREVILMSDAGAHFRVMPEQLSIIDRAWVTRQRKGSPWKIGEARMEGAGR